MNKAFIFGFITIVIWASSFAAIRAGLAGGFSAGHLVLSRYLIASTIFAIYALWPKTKFRLPRKKDILQITLLGLTGISIYHIGITFGELSVSAGTAGMLVGSAPLFTALIAIFVLKERVGKIGWIGLGIGFLGIILITAGTSASSFEISKGALLIIMSAVATSILFAFQKSLLNRYTSIELTAFFSWIGTIPFLVFFPGILHDIQHATMEAHLSAIYIGIFPTAIGYVTWALALSSGKASAVTSLLYIEPIFVILIAGFWLHEWPGMLSIIGRIVAIAGVIVVNMLGNKQPVIHKKAA
ncbi:DMT family transporter [Bacillus sp. FJAT-49736]|uniref:DMT family transporter n=1 Tax=Bacillus sp. FJAT-49736 TaxID=2833582 RepID=UPI001BC959A1|nr:DMT family transporter [Bacillus sp. FJAT-49736]MBS4174256.1 DMT family transporter [Bacillus sp. FJAT-49736]